jgi:predicted nucleic acid-binding protein
LIDVLKHLGCPVVIPEAAAEEIQRRGPSDVSAQALAQATWLATVDPGAIPSEVAALAYALANPGSGAILDDRAARHAAAMLAILHQGTLALVIQAKLFGLVSAARPILEQLRQDGMYLSDQLMNQALAQIGE